VIEYCVCGHPKTLHEEMNYFVDVLGIYHKCEGCAKMNLHGLCRFKLDNLKLIEDLAKEKGIIK
jgi:hypothetical protein